MERLSSTLTSFYKSVIAPLYILSIVIIIFLVIFILPRKYDDLYVVAVPIWVVFASSIVYLISKMKTVYFDNEFLIMITGKKETKIKLDQIYFVKAVMYPFLYRIGFIEGNKSRSILFTARFGEIVFAFKQKSNSIDKLKKVIRK